MEDWHVVSEKPILSFEFAIAKLLVSSCLRSDVWNL